MEPPVRLSTAAAGDLSVRLVFFTLGPNLWSLSRGQRKGRPGMSWKSKCRSCIWKPGVQGTERKRNY